MDQRLGQGSSTKTVTSCVSHAVHWPPFHAACHWRQYTTSASQWHTRMGWIFICIFWPMVETLPESSIIKQAHVWPGHHAEDAPAETLPAAVRTLQNYKTFRSVHFSTAAVAEASGNRFLQKVGVRVPDYTAVFSGITTSNVQHHHQVKCHLCGASENTAVST
jgi:hypothetical protein